MDEGVHKSIKRAHFSLFLSYELVVYLLTLRMT